MSGPPSSSYIETHARRGPGSHPVRWPPHGEVLIEAQRLIRDLGTETNKTRILHDIDLVVREGEFVSLTGLSGSGKSTLLYLLGALDKPSEGQVLIDGIDIGSLDDDGRAAVRSEKIGFVFQFHFLLPEFTVLENVMIPILRRGARTAAEAEDRSREAIELLGLGELARRRPGQLSGGQQQRVSIARAVANEPRLILADEPTGNLDSRNGHIVMDTFERLVRNHGMTIIMVTHERTFATRASRQIELQDGRIIADIDQREDVPGAAPLSRVEPDK